MCFNYRLNIELDLQSLFGLLCTYWLRSRNSLPPVQLDLSTRAQLVSQDGRHLFVTPGF
jgi:hypothetical protein